MRSDPARFARQVPAIVVLAALGEVTGSLVAVIFTTSSGFDPALGDAAERLVHIVPASLVIGIGLSAWFAGAPAAFHEFALAVIAVNAGLLVRHAVMSPTGPPSALGALLAIVVVLLIAVPSEYWIWRSMSPSRVRATDRRLWRTTNRHDARDARLAASALGSLRLLRRQETDRTSELVEALVQWTEAWLAAPDGVRGDEVGVRMLDRIQAAMTDLYGPPTDPTAGPGRS